MLIVRLADRRIVLDPPQHLLVLWVTDSESGKTVTVFHESGYEAEGMVVSGRAQMANNEDHMGDGLDVASAFPAEYLAALPDVAAIDLNQLPAGYRFSNDHDVSFTFRTGIAYQVSLVGDRMYAAAVIAE
jgi:hypothetical protein